MNIKIITNTKCFNIQPMRFHVDLCYYMDGLHVLGLCGHKNST